MTKSRKRTAARQTQNPTMATMVCGNFTIASKDDPNLGAKFTDWLERFENELIAWGITNDLQKKALLKCL